MKNLINTHKAKWENYDYKEVKKRETKATLFTALQQPSTALSINYGVPLQEIRTLKQKLFRLVNSKTSTEAEIAEVVEKIETLLNPNRK